MYTISKIWRAVLVLSVFLFVPVASIAAQEAKDPVALPPAPMAVRQAPVPIELSGGHGRHEVFWTPTRDLLLFDTEGGDTWIRRGDAWALMAKVGGSEEAREAHARTVAIVVKRAVSALEDAERELTEAYGDSHPSVIAIRQQIADLSAQARHELGSAVPSGSE